MTWWIVLAVVVVMLALRWLRVGMLAWLAAWWLGIFAILRYGFTVPVPVSVIKIYMGIVSGSLVAYVFADRARIAEVRDPLVAFLTEKRYLPYLALAAVAIPAFVAFQIHASMTREPQAQNFARTVHPATPQSITVHDQTFDIGGHLENPYRELETKDPEEFRKHVAEGRRVYYQNCFYCHGDLMSGEGMVAHGLNPIPTNFQDQGNIPMLRESFLFWRISKGGPGLPAEGGPWDSAMPVWENFLETEEIWDVILFLYDFTGYHPRASEEVE